MGLFPVVQSPCPYKGPLADILEGSMCRLCHREVHDLGAMAEPERIALVSGCKDEICVRYAVPRHSAIAAAMLGVAALSTPAHAQGAAPTAPAQQTAQPSANDAEIEDIVIVAGGLRAPGKAKWHSDKPAAKGRELPVVVEAPARPDGQAHGPIGGAKES